MLSIIEEYNRRQRDRRAECDAIDTRIGKAREEIERAKRRIERLEKKRNEVFFAENWVEGIVDPLAQELATRTGLCYEIYGPFGLRCETSIYLRKDMSKKITEQETRSITLTPGDDGNGNRTVFYDTGETDGSYQKGSIGHLNGMHHKTAPLPDTIEEIEALLVTSGAST